MRSGKGGSNRVVEEALLLLLLLLSTCNAAAGTPMLDSLGIRGSRLQETQYGDVTVKTLKGAPLTGGGRTSHVLDSEARGEVIGFLTQALALEAQPSKKKDAGFHFFSARSKGKDVYVFRSAGEGSPEKCHQILAAMEKCDTALFKTPLVYASSPGSPDHFFLGYMISGTTPPLPNGVISRMNGYGVQKLPSKEEEKKE